MRTNNGNAEFCHAFTLIEMVVVIVIIAITAALIIPEMKGTFQDTLLRSTGRELVNVFSLASSHAVSLDQSCRVQLDPKTGRYLVERKIYDGGIENFVPLKDVPGSEGKLDTRIAIEVRQPDEILSDSDGDNSDNSSTETPSQNTISFYPDGTADAAEIQLRDRDGFQLILKLNPITSRVHITEPEHE